MYHSTLGLRVLKKKRGIEQLLHQSSQPHLISQPDINRPLMSHSRPPAHLSLVRGLVLTLVCVRAGLGAREEEHLPVTRPRQLLPLLPLPSPVRGA